MTVALAPGTTNYEMTKDRELTYTRVFAAPRSLVYSAFTEAEHLPHWMGMVEGGMKVPHHDHTVGGTYRWEFYSEIGELEVTISGQFTEIVPGELSRNTEKMEFGGIVTPEYLCSMTFSGDDEQTTIVGMIQFPDAQTAEAAVNSGMKVGMDVGFDRLDARLATLA